MNLVNKQLALFFGIVLALSVFRMASSASTNFVDSLLREKVESQNIPIEFNKASFLAPRGLRIEGLKLPLHRIIRTGEVRGVNGKKLKLDDFQLDWLEAKLLVNSLLKLQPVLSLSAALYEGTADAIIEAPLSSGLASLELELNDLNISQLPATKQLGISRGLLQSKVIGDGTLSKDRALLLSAASLDLQLKDATYQGGHLIGGLIPLPAIETISADIQAKGKDLSWSLEHINLQTSLGAVEAFGDLSLSAHGKISEATISADISLSPEGVKILSDYFALAAKLPIGGKQAKWSLKLKKSSNRKTPNIKISAS